jgi:hypothetical protein
LKWVDANGGVQNDTKKRKKKKKRGSEEDYRNSAQMIVDAHNLRIKNKIDIFESIDETCRVESPCSIVITQPDNSNEGVNEMDRNANRLSIASSSSVESSRSDNNCEEDEAVHKDRGSSVFYVVWD